MKSKKSFFSKELIYNNLRRFWWISALFLILLFLTSPLLALTNTDTILFEGDRILNTNVTNNFWNIYEGTIILLFSVPVFIGVMIFRYMQNPKSMVAIHSMPYTRLRLYFNNILSGLILLITPILLNTAILSTMELGGAACFENGAILKYLWVSMLVTTTLYVWTIFIGMFTGSSIAQIVFTYILNFLIPGIVSLVQILLEGILYGYTISEEKVTGLCSKISPIVQAFNVGRNSTLGDFKSFILIDVIVCVVFLVGGYFVYKFRDLESAGDVISGKYVKPIFKYGVTACVMLVGAVYIKIAFSLDKVNIFIYLLFALIGYVIAEMLLKKSFKIWSSYKGFLIYSVVFILVLIGANLDLAGFEKYIPDESNIKSVSIDGWYAFGPYSLEPEGVLYDKENIKNVIELHKEIVADKDINLCEKENAGNVSISYEMLNGSKIKRFYSFESGKYNEILKKIYGSKEYIISTNDIFKYNVEDICSIKVSNASNDDLYITIEDSDEIKEFLDLTKNYVLSNNVKEGYSEDLVIAEFTIEVEEMMYTQANVSGALYTTTKYISVSFDENATDLMQFLAEKTTV